MKRTIFLIIFISVGMVLHFSCEKNTPNPENGNLALESRGKGKPGNGPKGDKSPKIYRLEYHGDLQGIAYGQATQDSKKRQVIDAGDCVPFVITGINELTACYPNSISNIWGPGARLIDKMLDDPGDMRVAVRLFINYNGANHWFNFFGYICCDSSCSNAEGCGNTILPSQEGDSIWLIMDRMVVESADGCIEDRPLTQDDDVRVEITLIGNNFTCP